MTQRDLPSAVILSGRAQSGKSTAARYLTEHLGYSRQPFARPLKEMLMAFLISAGMTTSEAVEATEGELKETPLDALCGRTPRHAMQTLGTEWGRELIAENIWTNAAINSARMTVRGGRPVVFDDCRFPNEVEAVVKAFSDAVTIRIERSSLPVKGFHASETALIAYDFDAIVRNDGTLEDLHAQINKIVAKGWRPEPSKMVPTRPRHP